MFIIVGALAVSSDDRYLPTRGVDRHVHIWDVHTREHVYVHIKSNFCFVVSSVKSQLFMIMCLQAFTGHRNTISSLGFRHGTAELYSGSFDRSVKECTYGWER